jgi:hypothetical protein
LIWHNKELRVMVTKTKNQLRDDILTLEMKRNALRRAIKDTKGKTVGIFHAFTSALRSTLAQEPNSFDAFVSFVTTFFADLKRLADIDFAEDESFGALETLCDMMGFDEATTMVIKQRIPVYFEVSKMIHAGTSEEEIIEFVRKCRDAEGRGYIP